MTMLLLLIACRSGSPPTEAPPVARSAVYPEQPPDWTVDCNGGGDFARISEAIAAADRDDYIQVLPCEYHDRLDFQGKSLWIQSSAGSAATEIDADDAIGVQAIRGESDGTALVGFTITDADTAVTVSGSALRLQDVVISTATGDHAIEVRGGDLELDGVVVDGTNEADDAAVFADRAGLTITRTTIDCGTADVALDVRHGGMHVDGATITCAGDDALYLEHETGRLMRSVVVGDTEILHEEDHFDDRVTVSNTRMAGDVSVSFGHAWFENVVFVDATLTLTTVDPTLTRIANTVFSGGGCAIDSDVEDLSISYSDFWNTTSLCGAPTIVGQDGNLAVNPLWVNPGAGDFALQAGSLLRDAGDPTARLNDVDGSRNDIGVTGGRFSILGGW